MPDKDNEAQVIKLRPAQDAKDEDRPLKVLPRAKDYCQHYRTELDGEARRVYCRDCGREIPAFDVLTTLARSHERFIDQRQEANRRMKVAQANLKDLERREGNAKSRVRGWIGKAPVCECDPQPRYQPGPWCHQCGGRV